MSPRLSGAASTATRRGQRVAATLLIGPFLLLFVLTLIVPIGYAAYLSLFREQSSGLGFGGTETLFAGLGNYTRALTDPGFQQGFVHIAAYCLVYIPVMIGGALVLALLIDSAMARAKRFFQLAAFLPHAVPGLIAAIIWVFLYTPGLSPIHQFLGWFGANADFLGPNAILFSMVNAAAWQWVGYNMVIFYAALQAIPRETLEAAVVDGAGGLRTALSVKLPMIRSSVVLTTLFTSIGAIQLFTEPETFRLHAQGLSPEWSPTMFIYQAAFSKHDFGLAAAASLLLAVLGVALSFVVTKLGNRWKEA
ncbi:carbohydrate ABC transporter permease [Streptomyces sp. LE64]|uniref:carbohydrate ABC transporter permease n=1 Tax=unclassified Streptomyces TaxID=2593676 RepID=UPI00331B6355